MCHRIGLQHAQRIEHARRTLDIRVKRIERRVEASARETLRCEMENIIRLRLADHVLNRERIAQIAIEQMDAILAIDARDELLRLSSGLRQRHMP